MKNPRKPKPIEILRADIVAAGSADGHRWFAVKWEGPQYVHGTMTFAQFDGALVVKTGLGVNADHCKAVLAKLFDSATRVG